MKKYVRRGLSCVLALLLCLGLASAARATGGSQYYELVLQDTADYLYSQVTEPVVGSVGGEWAVLGLARYGYSVSEGYYQKYYDNLEKTLRENNGVLNDRLMTDNCRVVVALAALGKDARDVAGYDLTQPLGDFDRAVAQGINGPIWALIALDSRNYPVPKVSEGTQATRQMYVDQLVNCQLSDGGWHLLGSTPERAAAIKYKSDPDITGMALQALAKYQDQEKVKAAISKALDCMSEQQNEEGGFSSWATANSESVSQMIVALCELGVSLNDSRFVKDGHSLLDALLSFENLNGGFHHTKEGKVDQMATEQAFYALVDLWRTGNGKNSLYRMGDAVSISLESTSVPVQVPGVGLEGKNKDVVPKTVTKPGITFGDIKKSPNKEAIEALAAREIINGMSEKEFQPEGTMTRAQFCTITVKALGLTPKANSKFKDVAASAWYAAYVGTANTYGIVNGVSDTEFNPEGTISRQEAAVMVARAAKLCGLDTSMSDAAATDELCVLSDYRTIASWAKESMAWCYQSGILDYGDFKAKPKTDILRGEIAEMLYRMLSLANLI